MQSNSKKRNGLFAVITVLLSTLLSLAAAEWLVGQQSTEIERSSRLDKGLIKYDPSLGWRLSALWSGNHQHHAFQASYNIDIDGRRVSPAAEEKAFGQPNVYWLGDSFTFGLGVDDDATFINQLNLLQQTKTHINAAVPGYSTDQQLLQLEEILRLRTPKQVVLVTYLGNDLFDNLLPFPLQAANAKPYFELQQGRLLRRNNPVPAKQKQAKDHAVSLTTMVWGVEGVKPTLGDWLRGLHIAKLAGISAPPPAGFESGFRSRHDTTVALYIAEVGAMQKALARRGGTLKLVLLPGRSAVEHPQSLSGQVQILLADMISQGIAMPVLNLIGPLQKQQQVLYFPDEGHLTPLGHKVVAELLAEL